jgi:hypothetical protein
MLRTLLASVAVRTLVQQVTIFYVLTSMRFSEPQPVYHRPALDPGLGVFVDLILAVAACFAVDPFKSSLFDTAAPALVPRWSRPDPAQTTYRFKKRLARFSAFMRWLVIVPSASRGILISAQALYEPTTLRANYMALLGLFHVLRILPVDSA